MRYHVFIEGSRDPSPGARERLAATLAQRYGLPPAVIAQRLVEGRFCAWASVDLATARRLGGELESIGANYTIAEDGVGPSVAAPALGRATVQSYAAPPPSVPPRQTDSGLAAARADVNLDLGALQGSGADASWQLSRLDGSDEERTVESPHVVAAVAAAERAVAGAPPATKRARASQPPAPYSRPVDPFAPPDADREAELQLEDKPTQIGTVAPQGAPPGTLAPGPASNPLGGTRSAAAVPGSSTLNKGPFFERMRETMADSLRARFLAGIAVAFLIGLIPAQLFAMWRTDAARDEVASSLQGEYREATTPEAWETLATAREDAIALVESRQRRVAVSAMLLWLATGAGVAFVWFRVIDWDGAMPRLAQAPAPDAARRRATR